MWKVRREVRRAWMRAKVSFLLYFPGKLHVEFRGLSIPVGRSGIDKTILSLLVRDAYELPEIDGLRRTIRPGDRVLEVGAGLGIVTALAARAAGPSGRVLSFEANPELIPATRDFLALHGHETVELRHAVLVPQDTTDDSCEFYVTDLFSSSSLLPPKYNGDTGSITVPAERVADVFADFQPDILICDIEGGEAVLLPALPASSLRAVVVELHPDVLSSDQIGVIEEAMAAQNLVPQKVNLEGGGAVVIYARES